MFNDIINILKYPIFNENSVTYLVDGHLVVRVENREKKYFSEVKRIFNLTENEIEKIKTEHEIQKKDKESIIYKIIDEKKDNINDEEKRIEKILEKSEFFAGLNLNDKFPKFKKVLGNPNLYIQRKIDFIDINLDVYMYFPFDRDFDNGYDFQQKILPTIKEKDKRLFINPGSIIEDFKLGSVITREKTKIIIEHLRNPNLKFIDNFISLGGCAQDMNISEFREYLKECAETKNKNLCLYISNLSEKPYNILTFYTRKLKFRLISEIYSILGKHSEYINFFLEFLSIFAKRPDICQFSDTMAIGERNSYLQMKNFLKINIIEPQKTKNIEFMKYANSFNVKSSEDLIISDKDRIGDGYLFILKEGIKIKKYKKNSIYIFYDEEGNVLKSNESGYDENENNFSLSSFMINKKIQSKYPSSSYLFQKLVDKFAVKENKCITVKNKELLSPNFVHRNDMKSIFKNPYVNDKDLQMINKVKIDILKDLIKNEGLENEVNMERTDFSYFYDYLLKIKDTEEIDKRLKKEISDGKLEVLNFASIIEKIPRLNFEGKIFELLRNNVTNHGEFTFSDKNISFLDSLNNDHEGKILRDYLFKFIKYNNYLYDPSVYISMFNLSIDIGNSPNITLFYNFLESYKDFVGKNSESMNEYSFLEKKTNNIELEEYMKSKLLSYFQDNIFFPNYDENEEKKIIIYLNSLTYLDGNSETFNEDQLGNNNEITIDDFINIYEQDNISTEKIFEKLNEKFFKKELDKLSKFFTNQFNKIENDGIKLQETKNSVKEKKKILLGKVLLDNYKKYQKEENQIKNIIESGLFDTDNDAAFRRALETLITETYGSPSEKIREYIKKNKKHYKRKEIVEKFKDIFLKNIDIYDAILIKNSILDLAKLIVELTGAGSKVSFKPLPVDDPKMRRPDITKAKRYLKWKPAVSLEEGLNCVIEWFEGK